MKFDIGDSVINKITKEEGTVKEWLSDGMVLVSFNNIEIPVFEVDLEYPYLQWFLDGKNKKNDKEIKKYKKDDDFIMPVRKTNQKFSFLFDYEVEWDGIEDVLKKANVFIENTTDMDVLYEYFFDTKENSGVELLGVLKKDSKIYLHSFLIEELNDSPQFDLKLKTIETEDFAKIDLKIKPRKLFEEFANAYKNKKKEIIFYSLEEKEIIDLQKKKINSTEKTTIKKEKKVNFNSNINLVQPSKIVAQHDMPQLEVDLHTEKLDNIDPKWHASEIANIQMQVFEKALDKAIRLNQDRLIVIHGLGEGVLRRKIHRLLDTKGDILTYQNQYHPNYGFGATEIFFK